MDALAAAQKARIAFDVFAGNFPIIASTPSFQEARRWLDELMVLLEEKDFLGDA